MQKAPHFIGIGAQKAGTSWLHSHLLKHPDLWLPPIKELHFFDRSPTYLDTVSFLNTPQVWKRFLGSDENADYWRRFFFFQLRQMIWQNKYHELKWMLKFFLGYYDEPWYRSLFKEAGGKVSGEITPSYSALEKEDIEKVYKLLPHAKVILLLRNPIDRAWSQANFNSSRESLCEETMIQHFSSKGSLARGNLIQILENWRTYYPEEQIFIGFYDEIKERPQALIQRAYSFLGVRDDFLPSGLEEKIHQTHYAQSEMPAKLKFFLINQYLDQLKILSEMFGGFASVWFDDAKKEQIRLSNQQ